MNMFNGIGRFFSRIFHHQHTYNNVDNQLHKEAAREVGPPKEEKQEHTPPKSKYAHRGMNSKHCGRCAGAFGSPYRPSKVTSGRDRAFARGAIV